MKILNSESDTLDEMLEILGHKIEIREKYYKKHVVNPNWKESAGKKYLSKTLKIVALQKSINEVKTEIEVCKKLGIL